MTDTQPIPTEAVEDVPDALDRLLGAIAKGDEGAFAAFYDQTVGRVYGLALRMTQAHTLAEEIVCDVYLQLWRQADRYDRSRGNVMAWLMTLSRSRALDLLRRERTASRAEPLAHDEDLPDGAPHTLDLLVEVDQSSTLHEALKTLDDEQRQLLALAYFRGYSHSELAGLTGLPLGTVKTKLRRALTVLRERLAHGEASGGPS
jgi:RNA polymerase sigma-70 factor (ECF subfamily)